MRLINRARRKVGLPVKKKPKPPSRRLMMEAMLPLGHRAGNNDDEEWVRTALRTAPGYPLIDGPNYLDVLSAMHRIDKPDWYLEIGTETGRSLSLCPGNFVSIDPEYKLEPYSYMHGTKGFFFQQTSDDFFDSGFLARNDIQPSLGFLDGLHWVEFLLRDFLNFEKQAAPGAVAILHDCLPSNPIMAIRDHPAAMAQGGLWAGDVWKTLMILIKARPDLTFDVIDAYPTGLAVISGLNPDADQKRDAVEAEAEALKDVEIEDFGIDAYYSHFEIQSGYEFIKQRETLTNAKES